MTIVSGAIVDSHRWWSREKRRLRSGQKRVCRNCRPFTIAKLTPAEEIGIGPDMGSGR